MRVLLVIPAHNEEGSLPSLLQEIRREGYDALVINDASRDGTERVARENGAPVLSLPVNLGIGGGVQAGFMYAVRNDYDVVVQVDGDGQHDPARVADLVSCIRDRQMDCVVGSRYHPESPDTEYKTPFARRMGMHFSTGILYLATGLKVHDTTSGFRALSRKAFAFFSTSYPVDHPEAESLLMLHQHGFKIAEIPTRMRCRTSGRSLFSFFVAALYPMRVIIGFIGIFAKKSKDI